MHFDATLQIVTQDLCARVQRIREERNAVPPRAANSHYPFAYLLECHCCGGPLGGTIAHSVAQPKHRRHQYRCDTHFDFPEKCAKGQQISAWPVAYAVIPLVAQVLREKAHLTRALQVAAKQHMNDETMQQVAQEARAELEKANQGLTRVTDAIAEGLISREEAKQKLDELRDKKERLLRKLQSFEEREAVHGEILEAIKLIEDDAEGTLWKMFEHDPVALNRIVRFVFKPHSVVVEGYWDYEMRARSSKLDKRKGKLVTYELQDDFKTDDVERQVMETTDTISPVAQAQSICSEYSFA